jgi:HEPN domain-containing protein
MTNASLAQSYLRKARARLKALRVLLDEESYSDVVREAQEIAELCVKGMLRQVGADPPKWHDASPILLEFEERFAEDVRKQFPRVAEISSSLRKEREFSFYGDIDFIPTEHYSATDASGAMDDAAWLVALAAQVIDEINPT